MVVYTLFYLTRLFKAVGIFFSKSQEHFWSVFFYNLLLLLKFFNKKAEEIFLVFGRDYN